MTQAANVAAPTLCFIGLGEVAYHWLRTLIASGYPRASLGALYLDHGSGGGSAAARRAAELGVELATAPAQLAARTQTFLHATSPAVASDVFTACAGLLQPASLWVDLNSCGPLTKKRMAEHAATREAQFVDGAIMAPAWKHGHRTPVWVSGSGAKRFAAWGERWGTPTVFVSDEAGAAARVKMARSVIVKGFAACLVEGLLLAQMHGITAAVVQSLRDDFGSEVIDLLCNRLVPGTVRHGERRAAEMPGVLELAEESHWDALTPHATASMLRYVGALGAKDAAPDSGDYTALLQALVARIRAGS